MLRMPLKPCLALAITAITATPLPAAACGADPILGEICTFAFDFCPNGYLPANGSLQPIAANQALFALLGTTYGGDGRTTFGLPDLRGRTPIGAGQGVGLSPVPIGQRGGSETVSLSVSNLPAHSHPASTSVVVSSVANAANTAGNTSNPSGKVWGASSSRDNLYATAPNAQLATGAVSSTATATTTTDPVGSNTPVSTRTPFLGVTYCVVSFGIFPSRP